MTHKISELLKSFPPSRFADRLAESCPDDEVVRHRGWPGGETRDEAQWVFTHGWAFEHGYSHCVVGRVGSEDTGQLIQTLGRQLRGHGATYTPLVVLDAHHYDAILRRLSALEAIQGIVEHSAGEPVTEAIKSRVLQVSRALFGNDTTACDQGVDNERAFIITARIPREMDDDTVSRLSSEWYGQLRQIAPNIQPGRIGLDLDFQ